MKYSFPTVGPLMTSQRWIAHSGHIVPAWTSALRRELVAAFRRGSMSAERCLRTYLNQGEPEILPFEAVVFLAARVASEHLDMRASMGSSGTYLTVFVDPDLGENRLAELCLSDPEEFEALIEAGRRFFFPGYRVIG